MSIKVLIKYPGDGVALEKNSKLAIPQSWGSKTVGDVIGLFTKAYNAKSDIQLAPENMHVCGEDGAKIYSDAIVSMTLGDHCDYTLHPGVHIKFSGKEELQVNAAGVPLTRCKNYGCQQMYDEEDNEEGSCRHHTGPPIFHDTMKCWSCCRDRKAYDFENFQLITGCSAGKHSTVDPSIALHSRHTVFQGERAETVPETASAPMRSISDYNVKEGGITAAEDFGKVLRQERRSSRHAADGTAKCQRKGCGKTFDFEANADSSACTYHEGQPVFHDAIKYWSCCADKKCYDFETFLVVPGCAKGVHDDGVINI